MPLSLCSVNVKYYLSLSSEELVITILNHLGKKDTFFFFFSFQQPSPCRGEKCKLKDLELIHGLLMAGTLDGGSSPETSLTGYGFFSFLGIVLKFLSD